MLDLSYLVLLTIFVLGPTVTEFIRQSVLRNIRGILDVILFVRCEIDAGSFFFLLLCGIP